MNRPFSRDLAVFLFLVVGGVVVRVAFQHIPNFAPVAGLALFAGYFFGLRGLAAAVPLTVMLVSDRLVDGGGYALPLMLTVYGLLTLPVLCQGWLRKSFSLENRSALSAAGSVAGLMTCSLLCSLLFFLGTNLMVWASGGWYEPTVNGLLTCYASAIPFFRYTLAGDLIFATVLFGGYACVCSLSGQLGRDAGPVRT